MASDSKSWQFILKDLSKQYRVIIFDNRGCGRTTDYEGSFSLKDLATDVSELLEYLRIDQAHVLGHSMGGMIAQEMALAFPEKINKLILASSSPILSERAEATLNKLYKEWKGGCDMADWFRELFQWLFTKEALENKQFMDAAIIFALNYPYPQTLEGFEAQAEAINLFDARDRIHNIHHNTLIISGAEDILIPAEESKKLLKIGGKCEFIEIQHAAHSIHAEKPKEFAEAVTGFINKA
jgi:pimeloyl-ACP methyl ester carboxylesterase